MRSRCLKDLKEGIAKSRPDWVVKFLGSPDGDILSVGLSDVGFEVIGFAVMAWNIKGLAVGICVGGTVGDVGFRVVGLPHMWV
jgi:hypothetical protein